MADIVDFGFTDAELVIDWSDGQQSRLAALWLRDHCQRPESRDPRNGQRLLNVTDIPENIAIESAEIANDAIRIRFTPESWESDYDLGWLRRNCYCINQPFDDRAASNKRLWNASSFAGGLPRYSWQDFTDEEQYQYKALRDFAQFGFVLLEDVPCVDGQVLQVVDSIGFTRETNYGPLFEVRTVIDPNNLAYSNLGLGCHTDNPYRDPVPTIQLLHCLESSTDGGDSIFVDGFNAAAKLREGSPALFDVLVNNWINFG